TIQHVISTFKMVGCVNLPGTTKQGRPHILSQGNVNYLKATLDRTPDTYLDELRDDIEDNCGAPNVSLSTIWRTLQRSGITRKK
ncbi:hypothetical protein BS47DRAFT_1254205, partial [Hydnum rufescens UP504]